MTKVKKTQKDDRLTDAKQLLAMAITDAQIAGTEPLTTETALQRTGAAATELPLKTIDMAIKALGVAVKEITYLQKRYKKDFHGDKNEKEMTLSKMSLVADEMKFEVKKLADVQKNINEVVSLFCGKKKRPKTWREVVEAILKKDEPTPFDGGVHRLADRLVFDMLGRTGGSIEDKAKADINLFLDGADGWEQYHGSGKHGFNTAEGIAGWFCNTADFRKFKEGKKKYPNKKQSWGDLIVEAYGRAWTLICEEIEDKN